MVSCPDRARTNFSSGLVASDVRRTLFIEGVTLINCTDRKKSNMSSGNVLKQVMQGVHHHRGNYIDCI